MAANAPAGAAENFERNPRHALSQLQAVAIIVGIVIGAGIFEAPSVVAGSLPSEP